MKQYADRLNGNHSLPKSRDSITFILFFYPTLCGLIHFCQTAG